MPHGTVVRTRFNPVSHVQAQQLALRRAPQTFVVFGRMMEGLREEGRKGGFPPGSSGEERGRRKEGHRSGRWEEPQQGGAVGNSELKRIQNDTAPSPPPIPQDPQPREGSRVNEDRDPASQELDLGSALATTCKHPEMWVSVGLALIYPGSASQQVGVHHLLSPPHPGLAPEPLKGPRKW